MVRGRYSGSVTRGKLGLDTDDSPEFSTVRASGLTANRLVKTDANKDLASVSNFTNWIAGSNNISIDDDSDGTCTVNGSLLVPYTGATGDLALGAHGLQFSNQYSDTAEFNLQTSGYLQLLTSTGVVFAPSVANGEQLGDATYPWGNAHITTLHSNTIQTITGDLTITATGGDVTFDDENHETTGKVGFGVGSVSAPGLYISGSGVETNAGFYRIGANNWGLAFDGAKKFDFSLYGLGNVDGSAAAPSYTFNSDLNTGMSRLGADRLGLSAGGNTILEANTSGVLVTGSVDATSYKVGGAAGTNFSGAVTNITVVNGIVTAVS
jgi:hypothetical protein